MTSGFNIATNLSMRRSFSDFLGFTHDDLRTMLAHYRETADISFAPQLERYPDIGWAMLIELKYLKKEDDASPAALAAIRAEAIEQLDRYADDHDIACVWGLESSGGHVKLVRLVIVFQGGDRVLCEVV